MAEKECSQCKQNLNGVQKGMLVLSIYILIASVYGTIKLYELVASYF
jgi:hypothetical protein